ncbi:phage tail protein [Yersinia enterocolitica]
MQKIGDIPNTRADSNGEFTDGNVAGGVPPTILPAAWFNTIQRELMSVLSAAEIDADSAQFNQVLLSIQKLIGEEIPDIKDASLTQKGIVQLSNATNSTSEVLAATPKAVRAVDIAALKIANNLSEIKAAGPAAVEQTLNNIGLTGIGIGLPTQTDIANFDWQNFVFTSGANYVTSYSTWINPPAGVTYNAGTRVSIRVAYISTGGSSVGLEITPDTTSSTNFKVYKLLCTGAPGSRVFTFNQDWNSANPIPISGGGTGAITASTALANLGGIGLSQLTGIVGTSRNAKMSVVTTSATSTFSADELIVQTAIGGNQYKLSGISNNINLATSGAGGMDSGTVPTTGYVALYVIFNPTTSTSALLAVNTTSVLAPEVCGGVMPSGYTASALVSVWRIVASKFIVGEQTGRSISTQTSTAFSITVSTPATTIASISSIVPLNANKISGYVNVVIATTGGGNYAEFNLYSSGSSVGRQSAKYGAATIGDMNCNYEVSITNQSVYYSTLSASGSLSATAYITRYEF